MEGEVLEVGDFGADVVEVGGGKDVVRVDFAEPGVLLLAAEPLDEGLLFVVAELLVC